MIGLCHYEEACVEAVRQFIDRIIRGLDQASSELRNIVTGSNLGNPTHRIAVLVVLFAIAGGVLYIAAGRGVEQGEPAMVEVAGGLGVEEALIEKPSTEDAAIKGPAIEVPVVERPAVEGPAIEESMVEEPVIEGPALGKAVTEKPGIEKSKLEEAGIEKPSIKEAATEGSLREEAATEVPARGEPETKHPVLEEPATREEFRGLWVVRTSMQSQESVEHVIDKAAKSNFNAILVQVNGRGEAYYESDIVPKMPAVPEGFDPLAFCIEKAHAAGIEVHAWINAFTVGELGRRDYHEMHILSRHPEWSLVDLNEVSTFDYTQGMARGELVSVMLDPAIEGVKEYVRDVFLEVVTKYDVDGVHFDYIRYPGKRYGYSQEARDKFRELTGYDPLDLVKKPAEFQGTVVDGVDLFDSLSDKWNEFRRDQVTEVVRRVYQDVKKIKPDVAVSCAVFANADEAYDLRLQDWRKWVRDGIVDFIVPMAYTPDTQEFKGHIMKAVEASPGRRALAGVGVYRMLDNPRDCIEKIDAARELGTSGVVLFSYDSIREMDDYWEALAEGPFSDRAKAPRMIREALD